MNIFTQKPRKSFKRLNESQQVIVQQISPQQKMQSDSNSQKIQDVFGLKTNQFTFSNGVTIGNVNSGVNNPFGLLYYINKSNSFENFIELLQKGIGFEIESKDISKLKTEYNKVL